ncbi:MAG: hypothetical protein J0L99_17295 [Chitinophagales bacterium]|nr:hypothetical protein [Chitinophagales bacterium]
MRKSISAGTLQNIIEQGIGHYKDYEDNFIFNGEAPNINYIYKDIIPLNIIITDLEIEDDCYMYIGLDKSIIFVNVQFKRARFSGSFRSLILDRIKCTHLNLLGCNTKDTIIYSSSINKLDIKECKYNKLKITHTKCINSFWVSQSLIDELILEQNTSPIGLGFRIHENCKLEKISISSSILNNNFIVDSSITTIEYNNSNITFLMTGRSNIESFLIENSSCRKFRAYQTSVNLISFGGGSALGNIEIENSEVSGVIIERAALIYKLSISAQIKKMLSIHSGSKLEFANLDLITGESFELKLNECSIYDLKITNVILTQAGTIKINNCAINSICFDKISNNGIIFISTIKSETPEMVFETDNNGHIIYNTKDRSTFELPFGFITPTQQKISTISMLNSDLGNFQCIGVNLSNFKRFEFLNSKILQAYIAETQLPSFDAFTTIEGASENEIHAQRRLAFGQFKKVFENQGDTVTSLSFLAQEMEAYRRQLIKSSWKKHFGELLMLSMNKWSTNYGTDWLKGLKTTLIAVLGFFSMFCYLAGYRFGDFSPEGIKRFWDVASYAPYYLNPLRDKDSVSIIEDEKTLSAIARVWDFLSRIVIAYLVYQTIQAFRKLGKSSG